MYVCSLFAGRSPETGGGTGGLLEEEREGRRPWREESGRVVILDDGDGIVPFDDLAGMFRRLGKKELSHAEKGHSKTKKATVVL